MTSILKIEGLKKRYGSGHEALSGVDLDIEAGEILALLGPNGAGKTTLISIICGLVTPTGGDVHVGGHDIRSAYRQARSLIGLVPQEIALEPFETVWNVVRFSRGLFGKPRDDAHLEAVLRSLSLWEKRNAQIRELSGGMKRRVLIAKALAHEPKILFLDEPTAGVDVELRRGMWEVVEGLRAQGVTIILTTHYIEEAEEIADRIAVINKGQILLVEEKAKLMARMGQKELRIELQKPVDTLPTRFAEQGLELIEDGHAILFRYDTRGARTGIASLLAELSEAGIVLRDIVTRQSSLEEIFVGLLQEDAA